MSKSSDSEITDWTWLDTAEYAQDVSPDDQPASQLVQQVSDARHMEEIARLWKEQNEEVARQLAEMEVQMTRQLDVTATEAEMTRHLERKRLVRQMRDILATLEERKGKDDENRQMEKASQKEEIGRQTGREETPRLVEQQEKAAKQTEEAEDRDEVRDGDDEHEGTGIEEDAIPEEPEAEETPEAVGEQRGAQQNPHADHPRQRFDYLLLFVMASSFILPLFVLGRGGTQHLGLKAAKEEEIPQCLQTQVLSYQADLKRLDELIDLMGPDSSLDSQAHWSTAEMDYLIDLIDLNSHTGFLRFGWTNILFQRGLDRLVKKGLGYCGDYDNDNENSLFGLLCLPLRQRHFQRRLFDPLFFDCLEAGYAAFLSSKPDLESSKCEAAKELVGKETRKTVWVVSRAAIGSFNLPASETSDKPASESSNQAAAAAKNSDRKRESGKEFAGEEEMNTTGVLPEAAMGSFNLQGSEPSSEPASESSDQDSDWKCRAGKEHCIICTFLMTSLALVLIKLKRRELQVVANAL